MHNNVLCCSVIKLCPTLRPHGLQHTRLPCPSLSSRVCSNSCPLKLVMPSNHLILCCPLLFLPSISPSIRVFSNELALHFSVLNALTQHSRTQLSFFHFTDANIEA